MRNPPGVRVVQREAPPAVICNCSMYGRAGTVLTFAPVDMFILEQGEQQLTDYQFNKHVVHHLFCKTCGIKSFARSKNADGKDVIAINVRCLDDVDLASVPTRQFDGKSR